MFQQGETATFFYEFETLDELQIPVGGVMLKNQYGMFVHGKNSLQFDLELPQLVPVMGHLFFRQEIVLEIAPGEYTFEVGLVEASTAIYEKRSFLHPSMLRQGLLRVCSLPKAGSFVVIPRKEGHPMVLTHYGACNLPGDQQLHISKFIPHAKSTETVLSESKKASRTS